MAVDNKQIAVDVLAAVGGKENISAATHCMPRLRLSIKDKSKLDETAVKNVKGVLGLKWAGDQCQVIIGQNVPKVYEAAVALGVTGGGSVDESLDAPAEKQKLTPKGVWDAVLDFMAGTMVQLIPVMMVGGLFRTLAAVLGPQMFGVLAEDSAAYTFLYTTMYDAAFYFLPLYLGYAGAKKLGANPMLGALCGGILISPTIIAAAAEGGMISIYGINLAAANYSQSVLPIMLSLPVLYFVEKTMKRVIPDVLSTIFVPFLTLAIMVPVMFFALAPLGNFLGGLVAGFLFGLQNLGGFGTLIAMALLGAFWQLMVVAGMHVAVIMLAIVTITEVGYDPFLFVSTNCAMCAVWGVAIGAALRLKDPEEKGQAWGAVVAAVLGGVTEPALFGVLLRYQRTMYGMFVGGAVGALVSGLLGATLTTLGGATNFLVFLNYAGWGTGNLVVSVIGLAVSCVVAGIVTYLFGFSKEELGESEPETPNGVLAA